MQAWRAFLAWVLRAGCLALLVLACDNRAASETEPLGAFINVGTRDAPLRLWVEEHGDGDPILLITALALAPIPGETAERYVEAAIGGPIIAIRMAEPSCKRYEMGEVEFSRQTKFGSIIGAGTHAPCDQC